MNAGVRVKGQEPDEQKKLALHGGLFSFSFSVSANPSPPLILFMFTVCTFSLSQIHDLFL